MSPVRCRHLVHPGGRGIPNREYCALKFRTKCSTIKYCNKKEAPLESGTEQG